MECGTAQSMLVELSFWYRIYLWKNEGKNKKKTLL